jgi:hypothetical protein
LMILIMWQRKNLLRKKRVCNLLLRNVFQSSKKTHLLHVRLRRQSVHESLRYVGRKGSSNSSRRMFGALLMTMNMKTVLEVLRKGSLYVTLPLPSKISSQQHWVVQQATRQEIIFMLRVQRNHHRPKTSLLQFQRLNWVLALADVLVTCLPHSVTQKRIWRSVLWPLKIIIITLVFLQLVHRGVV